MNRPHMHRRRGPAVALAAVGLVLAASASQATAQPGFTAELYGEGQAEPAVASCGLEGPVFTCVFAGEGPRAARCRVNGEAGVTYRELKLRRRGSAVVSRACYLELDTLYPEPLRDGRTWKGGFMTCRVRLVGAGIAASSQLRCVARSGRGFTLSSVGRLQPF